uniref:Uncharacterized protein n=1 Tax=Denticeps clupeoides TaxID=299321 RepID=A0AAY4ENA3_9TELE
MAAGAGGVCFIASNEFTPLGKLTSMCSRVKITGSDKNTRLDSLLMDAAMTSEFTATERLCALASFPSLMVAFSVLRNCPRFL